MSGWRADLAILRKRAVSWDEKEAALARVEAELARLDAEERSRSSRLVNEQSFQEHVDRWLTSNRKQPEDVMWARFPLGMVGLWIDRAVAAEAELKRLQVALEDRTAVLLHCQAERALLTKELERIADEPCARFTDDDPRECVETKRLPCLRCVALAALIKGEARADARDRPARSAKVERLTEALQPILAQMDQASEGKPDDYVAEWAAAIRAVVAGREDTPQ